MLLKEACDDMELAAICHRWSTDKFMFWARDWEEKRIQRVIREWNPIKIAEIFQHRLLRKSVLDFFLRTWPPQDVLHVLEKCKSDVFVYKCLCTMYYTEKRIQESDVKGLLEEYEETFASQVLYMFQSHEAAHFIKHWNDSYTNQILGHIQDKSWVCISLSPWLLFLHINTHAHTHTQVADALAGRMELRAESSWGALFDGKDLSNVKELRKTFDRIDEDKSGELDADEILTCLKSMGASEISKEDIESMMKIADTDGGGTVDFDEFVVMLRAIKDKADARAAEKKWISVFSSLDCDNVDRKVLRRAFKDLDVDGGGTLDKDEVKPLISAVSKGDDATIDRLIKESDVDGDGLIDFEEFVSMVRTIAKGRRR